MNKKLLIVLPACANDGVLAERLLDFVYKLNSKKPVGHLLIVSNSDLHQELRTRLRVTAEMAFESVTETVAPVVDAGLRNSKFHQLNNLFRHAALTAQSNFRWPWFWLEPDCVPVAADWIARIAEAYDAQPKKYMGLLSKAEKPFMARCGVYYPVASYELDKFLQGDAPFPLATAEKVIPSASHTDLVQYLNLETPEDLAKISTKAVVVHGDKLGLFAENFISDYHETIDCTNLTAEQCSKLAEKHGLVCAVDWSQPMQPQEIAKEISDHIDKVELDRYATLSIEEMAQTKMPIHLAAQMREIEADKLAKQMPRLSRRQKRELMQKPKHSKLDCVATEGCKSSIETATP